MTVAPPIDPPEHPSWPQTCADQSFWGLYATDRGVTLGPDTLARLFASDDLVGELGKVLADRGAVLPLETRSCPNAGKVLGEGDYADDRGVACGVCGSVVRPMEREELGDG